MPRVVSVLHAALGAIADPAVGALNVKVFPGCTALAVGKHDVGVVGKSVKVFLGFQNVSTRWSLPIIFKILPLYVFLCRL